MNKKSKITLFILTFISVVLLILLAFSGNPDNRANGIYKVIGTPVATVQKLFEKVGNSLNSWFNIITSYDDIKEEITALREENAELKDYKSKYESLEDENSQLREMIGLKEENSEMTPVAANVIAKDVTGWFNYFSLDVGTNDGVKAGCPVVTADGLVGIVSDATDKACKVMTVVDEQNMIMCRIERSNELVRVKGVSSEQRRYYLKLDRIAEDSELYVGDRLVTALSGGVYPSGIQVGSVSKITTDPKSGERSAEIEISVNLKVLSRVYVLTGDIGVAENE